MSHIREFYSGANVMLTGATGLVGKLLISKILIEVQDVGGFYLVIREKRSKSARQRLDELFDDPVFEKLKNQVPHFRKSVHVLNGDCSKPSLGLSDENKELIFKKINVVFHCAASLSMDAKIKDAVDNNVLSVLSLVHLGKRIEGLKALIYVSTAYSHCTRYLIEEKQYPSPVEPQLLINMVNTLDTETMDKMTLGLLGKWPNTYTFTKAVSEKLFADESRGLPVAIFRPSIIMPTISDPIPGWTGNVYGPIGVMAAAGLGVLRVMLCDAKVKLDIIPADYVANALICTAWEVHSNSKSSVKSIEHVPIYNCVGGLDKALGNGRLIGGTINYEYPASNPLWATVLLTTTNVYYYKLLAFLLHTVPGYLIDAYLVVTGKKPRMGKIYEKIEKIPLVLKHFSVQEYDMRHENVLALYSRLSDKDKTIYPFEKSVDLEQYFKDIVLGIKKYVYKESLDNAKAEQQFYKRLLLLHYTTKYVFIALFILVLYKLYSVVFYS